MQLAMYSSSKTKYIEYSKSIKHVLNVLWYKMRCLFLRSFILLFYDVYSSNNQWWTMMRNPSNKKRKHEWMNECCYRIWLSRKAWFFQRFFGKKFFYSKAIHWLQNWSMWAQKPNFLPFTRKINVAG